MTSTPDRPRSTRRVLKALVACALLLPILTLMPRAAYATAATDDFNRSDGALGSNWTNMTDGGLVISSNQVAGATSGNTGDIRTGETYGSDQYSQIETTSTAIADGAWIGPSVRSQNGGADDYLGLYWGNNGSPVLMLFKRIGGGWTQLGNTVASGYLAAGTQLQLSAVGSTITFSENGTAEITVTDTSLTGGAPGIMAYQTALADNWSGDSIGSGPTYTIGGTVSGLSGTVVLQNNGADDLNINTNGTFTFATPVSSTYNVTVKTNPAGQTCSVASGSGTATANVTNVAVTCSNSSGTSASDDFNRADGSLGSAWTDFTDGGMTITSGVIAGTNSGNSGDIRSLEAYSSDQYSQVEVTSTQISGGQWIGPAVRAQNGGQTLYLGLYWWNNGNPVLEMFKRQAGGWTQIGNTYASGALAAGTQLELTAVGSTLTFYEDGVARVTATDTSFTGGSPAVMAFGTPTADNWTGGDIGGGGGGSTYTVGGSATGLNGTVVLQNNGGDDLSVSANGSFTFATPLATGATYNVTVKTNPTGQSCSVSNGSGTVASANVTNITVTCSTNTSGTATDDFNRADGSLGANWTNMSDGGMVISSDQVAGATSGNTGDIRTAESYTNDQFSSVELTSTAIASGAWIGPTVRSQNGGQNLYLGIYFGNGGSPNLMLFKRVGGGWTQLGNSYASGALPAGTQLSLSAVGSTLTFSENGSARITATDTSLTGGAPGIMAYQTAIADNWSGGNVGSGGTFSVGGTVSGLSGTVVLTDNATDSLTVTADGSFTFGTLLNDADAYNVTVKTNPTGQSCSVVNGSGTINGGNVTNVAVTCTTNASGSGTDDFNRADGGLGPNWTDTSDGGLVISANQVAGANGSTTGDTRTAESYTSDQYSQVEVSSTPLTGGQWIGPTVRSQNGGQNLYVGIYYWNNGSPELQLFKRSGSSWQLLGTYVSGALSAGTQLKVAAVGDTITFYENGVERIAAYDNSYTGGAPGILSFGTGAVDNWAGGPSSGQFNYLSTDSTGIQTYDIISTTDGQGPHTLRVLNPTNPAPGVAHNFLFVLPVEAGTGSSFGDGLTYLQSLDAQDQYNLTIVEPTFPIEPWFADNPNNSDYRFDTFMSQELAPWVDTNLKTSGTEQNWLIGFSKSGIGGQDLILRHPDVFTLAASWDFPADMSSYDQFGTSSSTNYGTNDNFVNNYELSQSFLDSHKAPFTSANRIWIGGYNSFQQDVTDYDALLTSEGIQHSITNAPVAHRWDSGWVPGALAALYTDSTNLP